MGCDAVTSRAPDLEDVEGILRSYPQFPAGSIRRPSGPWGLVDLRRRFGDVESLAWQLEPSVMILAQRISRLIAEFEVKVAMVSEDEEQALADAAGLDAARAAIEHLVRLLRDATG